MYDGFTWRITCLSIIQKIRADRKLSFSTDVGVDDGEVKKRIYKASYKSLWFQYKDYRVKELIIGGNLNKYYTGKDDNSEDFSIRQAVKAIEEFCEEFDIPEQCGNVIKLEWGVNINLPYNLPASRLMSQMLCYKGRRPSIDNSFKGTGRLYLYELGDYNVKIYDKGAQIKSNKNLLRIELVLNRKRLLNNLGIYTLSDLKLPSNLPPFNSHLIDFFQHIAFYDHEISNSNLSPKMSTYFIQHNNTEAWENIFNDPEQCYRKQKKAFDKKVTKYSGIDRHRIISSLIEEQTSKLLNE